MIRVWFSAAGAAQDPPRPWRVDFGDGEPAELYGEVTLRSGSAVTEFRSEGFEELPDGPRAIICIDGEVHAE